MAGVEITNLSKTFRNAADTAIPAVKAMNLAVPTGELLVLVGPSGCGKTTTLRLLAGLEDLDAGAITLDGQEINGIAPRDRGITMVFQNHALYPHMTVRENLASGLRWRRFAAGEITQRVDEMAVLLGVRDCLDRLPEAVSGGQRQRVALGRALILRPKVLLLDEPLSNLDPPMRMQMRREIIQLNRRLGTTMIYVTHDQHEAMAIGHRIGVMEAGAIQQIATPAELYRRPANRFVAGFIGSPPMNFLAGTLVKAEPGLRFQPDGLARSSNGDLVQFRVVEPMQAKLAGQCGKNIILGIRPEHIQASTGQQPEKGASCLDARISVVEPAGSETLLHLSPDPHSIVVRTSAEAGWEPDQNVELTFDMRRAHFFDAVSGTAVL